MLDDLELRKSIEALKNIPTLPGTVQKIGEMVDSPTISATEVGKVIAQDQVLAAKVLRLINSSFYGFPGRISLVSHGVVLLGFNVVKGLVLSASVFDMMDEKMIWLWEHSMATSAVSGIIARHLNHPEAEEVAVAGLLHDIGKVLMAVELPEYLEPLDAYVAEKNVSRVVAEKEVLGITHCHVASWLCAKWNLPINLSEPLMYHHAPRRAEHAPVQAAIVHLANVLTRARGFGSGGDPFVPKINLYAWDKLGLTVKDLDEILGRFEDEIATIDEQDLFGAPDAQASAAS